MKKKTLTISDLHVKSFVTSFDGAKTQTVKGGAVASDFCGNSADPCATFDYACSTIPHEASVCYPCGNTANCSQGCTGFACGTETDPNNCPI